MDKLEKLSELEHDQWMKWATTLLDRMYLATLDRKSMETFYIEMKTRWSVNLIPYSELPEKTKEYDREWARKVLEIMKD